jgi:predicted Rossmann fold nucleotide-binding protein DprA/Smf involved in DNA uptake
VSLTRRDFALLLAMTAGVGGRSVTRVLARNDLLSRTPEEFLRLSREAKKEEYRLTAKACAGLDFPLEELVDALKKTSERLDKHGVGLVTLADAHYPRQIEEMDPDPPGALFLYGNTRLLSGKSFAVMSSRHTSPAGLEQIDRLSEEGVLGGEVLVAGENTPEYQRAAIVPLRWGSPRVLCLDRGLFETLGDDLSQEPFRAARLWRYEFDAKTDLVISAFRPDAHFVGVNNQIRDKLVACLSLRLDFVEIGAGGNMEKLAKLALKNGRPVRVSDRSIGYRALREAGASLIAAQA